MKSLKMMAAIGMVALVSAIAQNGPGNGPGSGNGPGNGPGPGNGNGPGHGPGTGCGNGVCTPIAVQPATEAEVKWIVFMREEEKLARDVYRALYERWKLPVFDRIAQGEAQHFTAIGTLIARYNIADPAATDVPGEYKDPRFTALYAELTAKGALSVKDALEVGVRIETIDIADLEAAVQNTDKYDLKRMFNNLTTASFSHLDAFESYLEVAGLL
jgi:hypothetical protein